jgi:hypothetical protein
LRWNEKKKTEKLGKKEGKREGRREGKEKEKKRSRLWEGEKGGTRGLHCNQTTRSFLSLILLPWHPLPPPQLPLPPPLPLSLLLGKEARKLLIPKKFGILKPQQNLELRKLQKHLRSPPPPQLQPHPSLPLPFSPSLPFLPQLPISLNPHPS